MRTICREGAVRIAGRVALHMHEPASKGFLRKQRWGRRGDQQSACRRAAQLINGTAADRPDGWALCTNPEARHAERAHLLCPTWRAPVWTQRPTSTSSSSPSPSSSLSSLSSSSSLSPFLFFVAAVGAKVMPFPWLMELCVERGWPLWGLSTFPALLGFSSVSKV